MSSANSFHLLLSPADKSFMYIANKRGPIIEPWGIPERISSLEEHWPFKATLCFHLYLYLFNVNAQQL